MIRIFENIDCMIGMEKYKDILTSRKVLVIADPPFGIGQTWSKSRTDRFYKKGKLHQYQNETPPEKNYFNSLFNNSSNQILFGANYYHQYLSNTNSWIVWDKERNDIVMSEAELAWTSFKKTLRIARFKWNGFEKCEDVDKIHPHQKPIKLYEWILKNYDAKDHDLILDTHVGSASSLVACEEFGIDYIGFELDPDYYRDAKARLEKARYEREAKKAEVCVTEGLSLFDEGNKNEI